MPIGYLIIVTIQLLEGEIFLALISALILLFIYYSHYKLGSDSFFHLPIINWVEKNPIAGVFFSGIIIFGIIYIISLLIK